MVGECLVDLNGRFKLVTGRTLIQGMGKERGKFTEEYLKEISTCELDPEDMKLLSIVEGELIIVKTEFGEAKLVAKASTRAPHRGVIFIPYGPVASLLTSPHTDGSGMPSLKGIEAEVFKG